MQEELYRPTYLLTWNPNRFNWSEYADICRLTKNRNVPYNTNWSCRTKKPKVGDRFFLLMQGQGEKNGIVGHGIILRGPYNLAVTTPYGGRFVDIAIKRLWDHTCEDYPKTVEFASVYPEQCWTPQMSGIRVKSAILPDIWTYIRGF